MKPLQDILKSHPRLSSFAALALAMVAILLVAARDVALEPGQRLTLVVSTVLLAAASVWIINWE